MMIIEPARLEITQNVYRRARNLTDVKGKTPLTDETSAKAVVFMNRKSYAPRGRQFKIHGNVVNVPAEVSETMNMLPRLPSETGTMNLKCSHECKSPNGGTEGGLTFLREEIPSTLNISMLTNVTNNQLINLKAKVVHLSGVKKIISRDDTKSEADCCLLDPSGSIKLTLWEDLITEVADDNTYNFCNLKVRKDNDNYSIYQTTPKHDSSISPADPFQEEAASPGDLPDYFT
ncbi:hypothetical protein AWC38_SpisGene23881 [Stylophora pistillata]|uniref:Uncharacterized protein n=1 Tax=Stylophora pistillata TaxID=50429 RepID=A0A2B4R755_STYPI|nr:hypothetical protein AWC38_SpisGene23881 [Stylophora pistillata]